MKNLIIGINILLVFGTTCCVRQQENTNNKYATVIEFEDDSDVSERRIRTTQGHSQDTLFVFFEKGFDFDTLRIQINNDKDLRTLYLTTDKSMDLAGYLIFKYSEINKISISKNDGPLLTIKPKNYRIWGVNYRQDTLIATGRKYSIIYE